MRYYVYRHIRLDTNQPFYVGVGTKKINATTFKGEYYRAFTKDRNDRWQKITNKTDYRIEILFESDNREEIYNKEIEFIKLYGREDLGLGILSNYTDGGIVYNYSKKTLKLKSNIRKNIRVSIDTEFKEKPLYKLDNQGNILKEYEGAIKAAKSENISLSPLVAEMNYRNRGYKGFYYCYIKDLEKVRSLIKKREEFISKIDKNKKVKVTNLNTLEIIIYNSPNEVGKVFNKTTNQVILWCNNKFNSRLPYKFEFL